MAQLNSSLLHITSWLSRQGGGMPPVIWALARESKRLGMDAAVAGLRDEFLENDRPKADIPLLVGQVSGPRGFGYSPELRACVSEFAMKRGVVHCHGLWMYPGVVARKKSKSTGCPLVISPHGMLEPWALNRSRARKQAARMLFEDRNLRSAHCLHALCAPEAENFRRYGLKNPIAVIPNGVDLEELHPLPDRELQRVPEAKGKKRMLFLSRIHPKKGLPNFLRAWQRLKADFGDWIVLIAGPDEIGHEQELKSLARELGIESNVKFVGPVYGQEKRQLLAGSDLFVLPSFSEGFSMAILEAAAAQLPVLLTRECNFHELAAAGGGVEISPNEAAIEAGLRQLLSMTGEQRTAMGKCGHDLVSRSYTWPAIARRMQEVYDWLLGSGPRPDVVQLDGSGK